MISAPIRGTQLEYYGWQASASAGGKVWAVYRHPKTLRTYTLHGQLKPELAGLKCTLYQKGKVLSDEDIEKLIASKQKGGYSSHNKGADELAEGLAAAGFDVPGKRAAKNTSQKSAKKRSAKRSAKRPKTAARQLVRVKKSIYLYRDNGILKPAWEHWYKKGDITSVIRRTGQELDSPIVQRVLRTNKQWAAAAKKKAAAAKKKAAAAKKR